MATHNVSTSAQLDRAFDIAKPGDVIKLAAGKYGTLDLNGGTNAGSHLQFSKAVTVTGSQNAVFTGLMLHEVENLSFEGITFDYASAGRDAAVNFTVQYSGDISFRGVTFDGAVNGGHGTGTGLKVKDSDDIAVLNSRFFDLYSGVKFNGGRNVEVLNNKFVDIAYDGLTFAGTDNLRVAGNDVEMKTDPAARHKDLIQVVNGGGQPATGVVISDNVLRADDPHTHGIYLGNDAARKGGPTSNYYNDIVIANNVIYSGHQLGIALGETIGGVISNNKVLQHPSMKSSKAGDIPVIVIDADSRGIKVTGNTTHKAPSAADYWKAEDTPSSWTISGNKIASLGTRADDTPTRVTTSGDLKAAPAPEPTGGGETLSGRGGADMFRFDGRKLDGKQTTVLSGVDFREGDELVFIRYDDATFRAVTGGNKLQTSKDGTFVRLESLLDVQELAAASKAVSASADRKADTLAINVTQKDGVQTVVLDGHGKAYLDTYNADLF